jgi:hypothetical protein
MNGNELDKNLQTILSHLDSIKDTLPMTMLLLTPYQKKANEKLQEFIKENVSEIDEENNQKLISIKYDQFKYFQQLSKNSNISQLASKIIPESLFVSLISQYDAFLYRLFKVLFNIRPEYINSSERELAFSQLVTFKSIESARDYVIEKEIETILRKSHSEHFEYLEKKLSIQLRVNLPIWKTFIEITERRNLYVHCDGIVSSQYLKVCTDNDCDIAGVELNQKLNVDLEYFKRAYECLYELCVKLTHTIWRKLIIEDLENADSKLNEICYELVNSKQFRLADILLDFACKQIKHFNESSKNLLIVNKSLSQYLQGNTKNALEIIESKDWSASSDDFKLAHLVLTDRNDDVYALMKKIGNTGEVQIANYKTWPLFIKLREEQKFKETFKEIFNQEYSILENPKRPVQELIEEQMKGEKKKKTPTKKK